MTKDNNDSISSTENNPVHSPTKETVQKMDEKSSSTSDEGNSITGLTDKEKTDSSGLSQIDDQPKCLVDHLKGRSSNNPSAENRLQHPDQDFPLSTAGTEGTSEKTERFQKNLEKFLKEREPLKEIQLRKKTEIPRRLLKSDGEMTRTIHYCGDTLKLPSNHPNRSSAPPTLINETELKEKSQIEKPFYVESSEKKIIPKTVIQTSNVFKKDSVCTKTSSAKVLDLKGSEISPFKVPISPTVKKTPDLSASMSPSVSKEDSVTPVQSRPSHFTMRPRKAFYTFSPGSSSGLLRCQSLPEINKPRRKDEAQRRSINFGEHSRIVRSLFKDKPEPATPESKVSTFHKSNCFMKMPERTENVSEEEAPKTSQKIPSNICRKLNFGTCSKETAGESHKEEVKKISCVAEVHKNISLENVSQDDVPKTMQNRPSKSCRKLIFGSSSQEITDKSQQAGVICDAESPTKRKNISPNEIRCSISIKKVRTSSETGVKESRYIVRKKESPVDVECSISASKTETCSETKTEVSGRDETELFDVGSSKNVRTSPETKMEASGSGENVRKNVSPIDVVCAISAKKVKTFSEKIVESENDENVMKPANPVDAGSSDSTKKETTLSETKIEERESD